jgi:Protein of unknown function, DUF481
MALRPMGQPHATAKAERKDAQCDSLRLAPYLAALVLVASSPVLAQQAAEDADQDVVVFLGDNRLIGEVRGLERGKLSFNTDSTGTIAIEWLDVQSVVSTQRFEMSTAGGDRYFGVLVEPEEPGTITIDTGSERRNFELTEVVGLAEIEQALLEGLDLDLSVGYQYTNASDITQLTLGWDVSHRREQRIAQANFDANSSSSSDNESSRRINLDTQFTFLRPERWLWAALLSFETNDELGLDLRASAGFGRGRILRQSNNNRFVLMGGVVRTREDVQLADEETDDTTLEGVLSADLEWFRFDTPELDVSTRIALFPNLSETGRFRTNLDVDFRWEIFSDLFLNFSVYHTHNSDPPNEAAQNDYGVTTSVGWEF